jgi:arabinose-5-phosphate isomerase
MGSAGDGESSLDPEGNRLGNYASMATEFMRLQAGAIADAATRLDDERFGRAVELLSSLEGKVVVTGAGTSGLIGRKVAATLTSTGTAAIFLHPSDALHGALGIVTSDDVAIMISNSGETDELLALLPYLDRRKVPIIAIVGNLSSTLASRADATLDAFTVREACPLNLAPTASTSVALAVGDALAMTIMQLKDITPERFALNHPSGRLGKRLTLTVDALMHGAARPNVAPSAPWLEVVTRISDGGLGAVTVEDDDDYLLGIITDGDLRRTIQQARPHALASLVASDIMTPSPVSVLIGVLAYEALQMMENRPSQISVLPVLDQLGRCVGLLRLHDLVRSGI